MAKIRKCKLSWEASASEHVIGYKLYWSKDAEVSYDSKFLKIGNVTEIVLPDDVTLSGSPVMFGVTAIDKDGNESDMVTLGEPYQMQVPEAPAGLSIRTSNEFKLVDVLHPQGDRIQTVAPVGVQASQADDPLAEAIEGDEQSQATKLKYYDDIGYRRAT